MHIITTPSGFIAQEHQRALTLVVVCPSSSTMGTNNYTGVIIGKDPQTSQWITRFEDGTEDKVGDPAIDEDYTFE